MIDLDELERLAKEATPGPWELWTGCSWRRFGSRATGETVCEPTRHPYDGHPDLSFRNQADGPFIAAANPTAILELVAELREARAVVDACIDEDNEGEQAYALAKAYRAKRGK